MKEKKLLTHHKNYCFQTRALSREGQVKWMRSESRISILSALIMFFLFFPFVLSWGPISHSVFNCAQKRDCFADPTNVPLVLASDMPDAMAFGPFNIVGDNSPNYLCKNVAFLHDLGFGAHMMQTATNQAEKLFGEGFMGHVMGDFVGFFPSTNSIKGGILCGQHVGPCNQGINYLPLWNLMADVDAYWFNKMGLSVAQLHTVGTTVPGQDFLGFMANASKTYEGFTQSVDRETIAQCVGFWNSNQQWVNDRAAFVNATVARQDYMHQEIAFYTGIDRWDDNVVFLEQQLTCIIALQLKVQELIQQGHRPKTLNSIARKYVASLYADRLCSAD